MYDSESWNSADYNEVRCLTPLENSVVWRQLSTMEFIVNYFNSWFLLTMTNHCSPICDTVLVISMSWLSLEGSEFIIWQDWFGNKSVTIDHSGLLDWKGWKKVYNGCLLFLLCSEVLFALCLWPCSCHFAYVLVHGQLFMSFCNFIYSF